SGRADDDQELRGFERSQRLRGERVAGGEILAVAKDRPQRLRHWADGSVAADEVLVDVKGFERAMQPPAPCRVVMAVAQEGAVSDRGHAGGGGRSCSRAGGIGD